MMFNYCDICQHYWRDNRNNMGSRYIYTHELNIKLQIQHCPECMSKPHVEEKN